jgi:hypothetical protein
VDRTTCDASDRISLGCLGEKIEAGY